MDESSDGSHKRLYEVIWQHILNINLQCKVSFNIKKNVIDSMILTASKKFILIVGFVVYCATSDLGIKSWVI